MGAGTMTCNSWLSCAYFIVLPFFVIFLAWNYRGEIVNEIHLLSECHFNVTSQAQKILSLTSELRQSREESNKLNQERKECLSDKDFEDSHYWKGFRHAALSVTAIYIAFTCIYIVIFYKFVCRCLERLQLRFQYREVVAQQHQQWQQAIQ